ncbi:MAG: restriction endonuclease subunit S [Prolixibacteraceae bacterium]|jgi:type I restriction enzyme S subunit|nr:restriction endonuclease subunit S [Prolixibacteraceae bacterium]
MSEWKETYLIDVTSKIGDGLHGTPQYDNDGEYHFINGNNLIRGSIVIKPETQKVNRQEFEKYAKPLSDKTILLSINGTIGNLALFNGESCILGKSACYINVNENAERRFIYYVFLNRDFQNFIVESATGTTIPNVPLKGIREYSFRLPTLPEQRAIASVLSGLDDKIDLLHRQNATLEAMAETLFRQWFVEEEKEDWEKITLFDAIDLIGGGTPKTSIPEYWNGNIKWLSGGDIANNHKSIIISSEKSITELGLNSSSAKLLPKFSTVISARGTVGKYCILSEPMTFSQSNYGIKPKYESCFFFTYLLIAHSVDELISAAYGSVFDTITTDTFKGHSVTLPKLDVIKNFEIEVTPLFQKILNNQTQIRTLTALQDTLLPKLMSGEVRVEI